MGRDDMSAMGRPPIGGALHVSDVALSCLEQGRKAGEVASNASPTGGRPIAGSGYYDHAPTSPGMENANRQT
jgi:hypothetical protein